MDLGLEAGEEDIEAYDARAQGLDAAFSAVRTLLETAKKRGLIGAFTMDSSDYDPNYWSASSLTHSLSLSLSRSLALSLPLPLSLPLSLSFSATSVRGLKLLMYDALSY